MSRFRQLIRSLSYVVSTHAAEELEDDNLSILDLENIVLTGQITQRQRDVETREVKCVVAGVTLDGSAAEVVVKVGLGGKLVVITVTSAERQCAHCGAGSPQLKYVTRSFGKGAALLVIEGIPMWSCSRCGESYFTAQTMHQIERIKTLRNCLLYTSPSPRD